MSAGPDVEEVADEEWRLVPGHPHQQVSNLGRHRITALASGRPGRPLVGVRRANGYLQVWLRGVHRTMHSLVMEAFVGPRPEGMQVCHNDGNRENNRLSNLRYDTPSANAADRYLHGTMHQAPYASLLGVQSDAAIARAFGVTRQAVWAARATRGIGRATG